MQVSQIEFYQFRNLENQLLAPGRGTTLIFGDNGQGKTNIIEAIWLFSCGKSFRAAADREMIRFGCDTARLKMRASDPVRDVGFEAVLHSERRKELFVCGEKLKKNADLIVANDVSQPGAGFNVDTNIATLITAAGAKEYPLRTKRALADDILDAVQLLRRGE